MEKLIKYTEVQMYKLIQDECVTLENKIKCFTNAFILLYVTHTITNVIKPLTKIFHSFLNLVKNKIKKRVSKKSKRI